MARQPNFKSAPEAVMANGRASASLIRETKIILRRTVELVKYFAAVSEDPKEKQALEEYLQDPTVNSAAEPVEEEKAEPKEVSERDRLLAKVTRVLKDATEQELDLILKIAKVSKKPPAVVPEKAPKGMPTPEVVPEKASKEKPAPAGLAKAG